MDFVVNVSKSWGIGYGGELLCSIPEDLRRFRQLTIGRTVIYGRKTLSTFPFGRPLKGRRNIILSTDKGLYVEGATVVSGLQELFRLLSEFDSRDVSVIGGASVYEALIPYCGRAYITKSDITRPADSFIMNLDKLDNWRQTDCSPEYESEGVRYRFVNYVNLTPKKPEY